MTFDSTSTNNVIQENFGGDPLLDGLPKDPLSSLPTSSGSNEPEDQFTKSAGFDGESNENFNPYPTATSWDEMETSSSPGTDTDEETTDSDRDPVTQEPFGEETSSLTEEAESDPITNPGIDREADEDTVNETSITHENKDKNIESNSSEESEEQENDSGQFNEDVIEEGDREITAESEGNHDNSDAEHESETSDLDSTDVVDSEADADDLSEESSDSTVNEQEDENSSDDAPTEAVNQSENSVESDRETDEMAAETVSESSEEGEGESDEGEETIAENDGDETGDRTEIDDTENNSTENNETDLSTESGADDSVAEHEEASSDAGSDSSNEDTQAELNDPTEANLTENDEEVNTEDSSDNGEEETEAESTDTTENHAEEDVATEETGESESDPVVDPNISESDINFDVGTFTVDESGEVGIDYLFDGGRYQGQVAIVSLSGMEAYEPGSVDFIQEAARRALSESELGHIAIDDRTEGAKFHTSLGERQWNQGDYQGVKTFAMRPGDKFFLMMVPNGAIDRVANDPAIGGASRPLFSLATANPDDEYHVGQIADITGDGSAFAWEDLRVDAGTDRDYNDIIFQVRGAKGVAAHMDDVVKPEKDWRTSDMGQALIDYIQPYITPEQPTVNYDDLDEAIAELEDLFGESESETFEEDFETDLEDSNDEESGSEEVNDELETDETTENDFDEGIEEESVTSENSESEENVSNSSSEEGETVVATPTTEIADSQDSNEQDPETEDPDPLLPTRLSDDEPIGAENTDDLDDESSENSNSVEASQSEAVETVDESEPELDRSEELSDFTENQPAIERVEDEVDIPISVTETSEAIEQSSDGNTTVDLENQEDKVNTIETPTLSVELPTITPPPTIAPADLSDLESLEEVSEVTVENRGSELRDRLDNLIEVLQQRSRDPDLTDTGSIETAIARLGVIYQGLENPTEAIQERANKAISRLEEWVVKSTPEAIVPPSSFEFPQKNQSLVGAINETGFTANNPNVDYSRITPATDRVEGDDNPFVSADDSANSDKTPLEIIDEINKKAPLVVGRALGDSEAWAQSLIEYVDMAKASGQPNAIVNLNLNLTEVNENGEVVPRYELTEAEWEALAYAHKHNILVVVPAGEDSETMSVLGQASLEFDNIITVGSAKRVNESPSAWKGYDLADDSGNGFALHILADGSSSETSGTSVAASKVAAASSQVWAANPKLSYRQVIDILQRTSTDLNIPNWDPETGAGLLNIAAAVHLAKVTLPIDVDVPLRWLEFERKNQPLIGIIDTGFNGKNPDIDYNRIILGSDLLDNDDNPLLETGEGNEHGTHVLGIIAATQGNGIGIDGMNDDAPVWLGRAVGSGKWAESLREFVDAAKASGQPNAVVNLSFDLTQTHADGTVTTRYELTPQEREALEYARQNGVMVVVAAGNEGSTMSALGQASQEFDNLITVGSVDHRGQRADYSNLGYGLDLVARGGTIYNPVTSTLGQGTDLKTFLEDSSDEAEEEDEMSVALQTVFEEEFGNFYDPNNFEDDSELPENWTDDERLAYEEATKAIDDALADFEEEGLQKIGMEFISDYLGIGIEASEEFLNVFDEDAIDSLIEAEEILGDVLENGEPDLKAGLEFSSLSDLDVDEDEVDEEFLAELMGLDFSIDSDLDMGTGEMAGTSVAAAKVTGAVSKVWAANPDLSYKQVKEILKATAVDLGSKGWDKETGQGLVDIAAAVALAKETQPEAYTPQPILSPLTWSGEGTVIPAERPVSAVQYKGKYFQWTSYTVRSGDNLSLIASRLPGLTGSDWSFIYNKNRRVIGANPNLIYPGQVLQIPIEDPGYLRRREEERKRQEAIRKAQEEARRAEAEARRLEEEARRAEEELRRLEEEARRQAEEEARRRAAQLAAAIAQWTPKVGPFGNPLDSSISNGVAVYKFAQGDLLIQPDGRSAYYNLNKAAYDSFLYQGVRKGFDWLNAIKVGGVGDPLIKLPNIMSSNPKDIFSLESWIGSNFNQSSINLNKFIDSHLVSPNRYWKTLDTLSPIANRLPSKQALKLMENTSSFFKSTSPEILARIGNLGAKTLNTTGNFFNFLDTPITKLGGKNAPVVGDVIDLAFTGHDLMYGDEKTQRRAQVKLGAMGAGAIIGGAVGALGFGVGAAPAAMGTAFVVGSIVDFAYFGADKLGHGDKVDKFLSDSYYAVGNGINSVKSSISNALKAAREKAAAARDKAQKAVQVAKATVKAAKATVAKAKVAYNTFKQQTRQAVSKLVQKSTQKFKASLQQAKQAVARRIAQSAPQVVKKVAQYARKAVNRVRNVVNGAKRVVSNVINKGKQIVRNVINKGKQAVQAVKNFASNVVNKTKQAATHVYNRAARGVKKAKKALFSAAKRLKFW